jgi:hypothetical protein
VVGEAGQRHLVTGGVQQPASQVGALRQQQREVVEAGVAGRGAGARQLDELQQTLPGTPTTALPSPRSRTSRPIARW